MSVQDYRDDNHLEFEDLLEDEVGLICNGCGGKGGIFNPPELGFHACCDKHDFQYWRGGDLEDKRTADFRFFLAMLRDAESRGWFRRKTRKLAAFTYLCAVWAVGDRFFNFTDRPRGWRELNAERLLAGRDQRVFAPTDE